MPRAKYRHKYAFMVYVSDPSEEADYLIRPARSMDEARAWAKALNTQAMTRSKRGQPIPLYFADSIDGSDLARGISVDQLMRDQP